MKSLIKSLLGRSSAPPPKAQLPGAGLPELFPDFKPDIKMLEPQSANGNVTVFELFAINFITAARSPKVIFEIGTFDGRTTLNMAANSPGICSIP